MISVLSFLQSMHVPVVSDILSSARLKKMWVATLECENACEFSVPGFGPETIHLVFTLANLLWLFIPSYMDIIEYKGPRP